jgi:amphi-Trp domain-containing protein
MVKKTVLLKSEEVIARTELADFLRQVAGALENGTLVLKQDGSFVTLDIPAQLELEVQVDEKPKKTGKKISVEFELEWLVNESGQPASGVSVE